MPVCGFLGENKKPDEKNIFKNGDSNDLLTLQMKYAINKINSQYINKKNSIISPLCDAIIIVIIIFIIIILIFLIMIIIIILLITTRKKIKIIINIIVYIIINFQNTPISKIINNLNGSYIHTLFIKIFYDLFYM